jgi:CAAX prenyl protease-like protein
MMRETLQMVEKSPAWVRALPYVLFVVPLYLQGQLGASSPFWVYALRTILGLAFVLWMVPRVKEMRWAFSWEAVVVGVLVFVVWVGLDPYYPAIGRSEASGWNPHEALGEGSGWAWFFVAVRLAGSTLVVPPLEEVFYRSFLYRYIVRTDFLGVSMRQFDWRAFVGVCLVFGFIHKEWLAGILCGAAYQALVLRKGRLGDAMTAHAVTNLSLGLWVISSGGEAWRFW